MNNTKTLEFEKILCKSEFKDTLISQWIKPKGYDLSMTEMKLTALHLNANLVFGKYSEFKKFLKDKHNFDTNTEACVAMVVNLKDHGINWNYMLIQENEWSADHYNTLVHELHHLVHFALTEKGVTYGEGGEEIYAYVQGYFMELVVRAFLELKRANAKRISKKK